MAAKKGGLGRGLESLFSDNATESSQPTTLRLSEIEPNRDQPRKDFDETALQELADSISKHGLLQPITVRPMPNSAYQIVAGERRWRACRLAGLDSVPVIIREMSDSECMELALIENLQREDLGAVEAAEGYKHLMDKYGFTQEQVAESVGKSRPAITNALRLLNLPQEVLERLKDGSITAGHARAMIGLDSERISLALMLAMKGASVREIEKIGKNTRVKTAKQPQNSYFKEVELALQTELGRRVKVSGSGKKGQLQIEFYSHDDLADLARRLADKQ